MPTILSDDVEIDLELSLLAFQSRVLALAEDHAVPLLERLRFLGIVTSNIDELYMVRMAELRRAAVDEAGQATERLLAVERGIDALIVRQSRCATECLREAARVGVRLLSWRELTVDEQHLLRVQYLEDIQPDLRPLAITLSPGHPLPHLPHLGLFLAVLFRRAEGERLHLAEHDLPVDMPRLLAVPDRVGAVIAIEEVLRANAHLLHPGTIVDSAYLFRVTRGGDLPIMDDETGSVLGAVALATERRVHNPAVRVEVERSMPDAVGALILDTLRREAIGRDMELTVESVQHVDGLLDLRCLQSLPLPDDHALEFPPMTARLPVGERSIFALLRDGDLLLHHPFDAFDDSVVRFFQQAAADPAVTSIKATLYRVGNPSPIVDALVQAASSGKRVAVIVELKARFDEVHNVQWSRALEAAGVDVTYGIAGLKVHAKVAMVTRLEGDTTVRYVHVGTGNYNPRSGRQYTDLSLFSARTDLADAMDVLFAGLTERHAPPTALPHGALVAPQQLLTGLLERIEREIQHAKAGAPARITIKINGLGDREMVHAFERASQAGVEVDLIVRGICILRPGVPGVSDRIRVISVVGRLLEHSRIYRFENGGEPEYLLGSSDLRSRNLRRRVEVLVPVPGASCHARLDAILEAYLRDGTAWELQADGEYRQTRDRGTPPAQVALA
ncbi:polyphosphate kinase 1 [Gemmatimonas sp.]|uniref:polyphosphate kinase 1 n=1 Tax=Gemmatimonas sp. TaxID=1962908 RepID=UPI003983D02E